ncbi:hypothetical protein PENTCL1PPCAC_4712, partial [Pristionchus entomophagus]
EAPAQDQAQTQAEEAQVAFERQRNEMLQLSNTYNLEIPPPTQYLIKLTSFSGSILQLYVSYPPLYPLTEHPIIFVASDSSEFNIPRINTYITDWLLDKELGTDLISQLIADLQSEMKELICLANLPKNIIKKIVGANPIKSNRERIETMRLISARWNTLAAEHLTLPENRPVMKEMRWSINAEGLTILKMQLSGRDRKYFGIEDWEASATDIVNVVNVSRLFHHIENDEGMAGRINRILARRAHIEQLHFNFDMGIAGGDVVMSSMHGAIVDQMTFKGALDLNDNALAILAVLRAVNVRNVHLSVHNPSNFPKLCGGTFFSEAVRLVPNINIGPTEPIPSTDGDKWREVIDWLNGSGMITASIDLKPLSNDTIHAQITMAVREQ